MGGSTLNLVKFGASLLRNCPILCPTPSASLNVCSNSTLTSAKVALISTTSSNTSTSIIGSTAATLT